MDPKAVFSDVIQNTGSAMSGFLKAAHQKTLLVTNNPALNDANQMLASTEVACRDVSQTNVGYQEDESIRSDPSQVEVYESPNILVQSSARAVDYNTSSIRVAVRIRPFLSFETGNSPVLEVPRSMPSSVHFVNIPEHLAQFHQTFTFDEMFDAQADQTTVYKSAVVPLVHACLEGYNATVLAYGQTGSGKTHTILGNVHHHSGISMQKQMTEQSIVSDAGIIPRTFHDIFSLLTQQKNRGKFDFNVKLQLLEVYGEDVRDLLGGVDSQKLQLREIGNDKEAEVLGAVEIPVTDAHEALLCVTRGTLRRVTRATAMNSTSSRSHAIITLNIEQQIMSEEFPELSGDPTNFMIKHSKFRFVDLAGSERIKRTKTKGQGFKEGVHINQGLLVLGQVISALASSSDTLNASKHVPYRDSKLTRLLRGSLGGNHKTLLIACVSHSSTNVEESLNTLRYANRAKNIKNNAVVNINESASTKLIHELRGQVQSLAQELIRLKTFLRSQPNFTNITEFEEVYTNDMLQALIRNGSAMNNLTSSKESSHATKTLNESNDEYLASQQQLGMVKDDGRCDDVNAEISNTSSFSEYDDLNVDDDADDHISLISLPVLHKDINMNKLSKETYESIKSVYAEKLQGLIKQIAAVEGEYENLSMQLCRHETDLQRFEFVKTSFLEDLEQLTVKIASAKAYIDDLGHLQIIPDEEAKVGFSPRSLRAWRSNKSSSTPNASSSTSQYYMEKLSKLEKHIRTRESELNKLVQELRKLELDSKIFDDLEKDINIRLAKKEASLSDLNQKLQVSGTSDEETSSLNLAYGKELEERDHLISELTRLRNDGKAFQDLFRLLSDDRASKQTHLNKYKKKHFDLAKSVGLPSPHVDHNSTNADECDGEPDDSSSVTSAMTFESELSVGKILRSVYDQKVAATLRDIAKYEAEKTLIQADLAKVEDDTASFSYLADNIKSKLKTKVKQIETLKQNETEFKESLASQERELTRLLKK